MCYNAVRRGELIPNDIRLLLPGSPAVGAGVLWAQWLPDESCFIIYQRCTQQILPPCAGNYHYAYDDACAKASVFTLLSWMIASFRQEGCRPCQPSKGTIATPLAFLLVAGIDFLT